MCWIKRQKQISFNLPNKRYLFFVFALVFGAFQSKSKAISYAGQTMVFWTMENHCFYHCLKKTLIMRTQTMVKTMEKVDAIVFFWKKWKQWLWPGRQWRKLDALHQTNYWIKIRDERERRRREKKMIFWELISSELYLSFYLLKTFFKNQKSDV